MVDTNETDVNLPPVNGIVRRMAPNFAYLVGQKNGDCHSDSFSTYDLGQVNVDWHFVGGGGGGGGYIGYGVCGSIIDGDRSYDGW